MHRFDCHKIVVLRFGPGPLTGTVLEYTVGRGGQIAVVTFQRGAAGVHPSNNVFLFERQTRQRIPLPADEGEVLLPTFSPDGNWIAWVALENQFYAQRLPSLASPAPQAPFGSVYIAAAKSPSDGRRVGSCGCFTWVAPAVSTPQAEIDQTAQITVPDAYAGDYHYVITYPTDEWRVETTETRDGPGYPELEQLAIDGCRMYLREGPRGLQHYGKTTLAGNTWNMSIVGETYPNYLVYSLPRDDKGIAFIIGLHWPREALSEIQAACQAAAEAVLDTFTLLE